MRFSDKGSPSQSPWIVISAIFALASNVQAKADIQKFFAGEITRYFPYRDYDNGCKDHAVDLSNSYKEASALIDAAVAAIASVKERPRPIFLKPKDRWNWDRKAQAMTSMFGVEISSKGGPNPESREDFNFVEDIFNQMKAGMDNDGVVNRSPGLYCGTSGWKFFKYTDDDPAYPTKKISDKLWPNGDPQFPNGVWYFNYNYVDLKGSSPKDNGMCRPNVIAETLSKSNFITWCDYAWSSLDKSIDLRAATEYVHLDHSPRRSMSQTWVHELAHFYGSYTGSLPDQPMVDTNGKAVSGPNGETRKTYGIAAVLNLAKSNPKSAARTADAYGWFAVAMYLSEWNWSKGFAEKFSIL